MVRGRAEIHITPETNGQTAKQPNSQTGKRANGQTVKRANGQTGKRANEQTGKWANGQTSYSISYLFIGHVVRARQQTNYQNRFPESTFHNFWGQAMKMLKICFQKLLLTISGASHGKWLKIDFRRVLLTISGAKQRKCSKSIAGGHF